MKKGETGGNLRAYGPYLTLGIQLAAAVIAFFFLGYWADERYGISPWGKLAGILMGSFGGLYQFFRNVMRLTDGGKKK